MASEHIDIKIHVTNKGMVIADPPGGDSPIFEKVREDHNRQIRNREIYNRAQRLLASIQH
jgi:hypothetical protein